MFIVLTSPPSMRSNAARRVVRFELITDVASDADRPFCCLKYAQSGKQKRAIFAADEATAEHGVHAKSGNFESRWATNPRATQDAMAT